MGTTITRDEIHSLIEDKHMLNNVVDAYVCLLNFENKRRGVDKKSRFFFSTECYLICCTEKYFKSNERQDDRMKALFDRMQQEMTTTEVTSFKSIQLLNAFADFVHSIGSNIKSDFVSSFKTRNLSMSWKSNKNKHDCGVFLLKHMETYEGESVKQWNSGLELDNVDDLDLEKHNLEHLLSLLRNKMQGQNEEKSEEGVTNIQEEEITYVRKRLTENLVTNFDTERCCLMLPKRKQEIFLEAIDVHLAYGLPLGGKRIEQPNDESNLKWSKFLKAWRSKFGLKKGSPTNKRLIDRIQELKKEKSVSDEFLWNFVKIAELDWCTFVIEHLKDSVSVWKKGNSYFTGPLPFLMVFYFDRLQRGGLEKPRKCPLISVWTKERIQVRYKFEKDHGFGYGKLLERMESIVGFLSKFGDLAKTLASNVKEMYGMLEQAKDLFVEEETTGKMQHLIDNIWCKYTTKTFVNQEEKKSPSILSQDQHVFDEPAFIEELDMVMDKAWKKFEETRSPKSPTVDLRSKEEEKDKNKEERNEENKDKNLLIPSPVVGEARRGKRGEEEEEKEEKKEEKEKKKEEEKEEKQEEKKEEKGKKKEEEKKEIQEEKREEKGKNKKEEKEEIQEEKREEKGKKKKEEKEENQEEKKENEGSKNEEKNKEEKNENKKGKQGEEKGEEKTRKKRGKDKLPMYLRSPFMVEHEKLFKNVDNRKVAEYAFAQGDNK
uniref:Ubiquitin-like protease family profile domain-containing protein n=1 Tax=Chenopodium quinoa TaxID=63459 RepID=A0A803N721_CHEQI